MPNPVKPHIKIVQPLTDLHFSALGHVISSWNNVELQIAYVVAAVSNAKLRSILFAFQNMTVRGKLDAAYSIMEVEFFEKYEGTRDKFRPLLDEARKLSGIRHAAAHSAWLGLTGRGHMVAVDIEARKERTQINRKSWCIGEFEAAIGSLDNLSKKLADSWNDYRSLPEEAVDFCGPDFS
jgi:GH18 family chitinase